MFGIKTVFQLRELQKSHWSSNPWEGQSHHQSISFQWFFLPQRFFRMLHQKMMDFYSRNFRNLRGISSEPLGISRSRQSMGWVVNPPSAGSVRGTRFDPKHCHRPTAWNQRTQFWNVAFRTWLWDDFNRIYIHPWSLTGTLEKLAQRNLGKLSFNHHGKKGWAVKLRRTIGLTTGWLTTGWRV